MTRFDWADKGIFDISDTSDEEFKTLFNRMNQEDKNAILEDLKDETASAEERKKAMDFVVRAGTLVLAIGKTLA